MKKKYIIIFLIMILCGCSKINQLELNTKEELRTLEIEKLKEALIKDGYEEISENDYQKTIYYYQKDGYSYFEYYHFFINSLTFKHNQTSELFELGLIDEYSLRTDIAEGTTYFYNTHTHGTWHYNYDFNTGVNSCTSDSGSSCSKNSLPDLKNQLLTFFSENNIDIELLK